MSITPTHIVQAMYFTLDSQEFTQDLEHTSGEAQVDQMTDLDISSYPAGDDNTLFVTIAGKPFKITVEEDRVHL